MAKRRSDPDSATARKIREKRSLGEGKAYTPWIYVSEIPSLGRSHIVQGRTVCRQHHLLSDLELRFFLLADFSSRVLDIREQFPLLPREETARLAGELGIEHPKHPGSAVNEVLTTDLLLTVSGPTAGLLARSIKYCDDLKDPRVREKLELEKSYWNNRGVDWALLTNKDIPEIACRNMEWLNNGSREDEPDPELARQFLGLVSQAQQDDRLGQLFVRIDRRLQLSAGQACILFKYFVYKHRIAVDINVPLELSAELSTLGIATAEEAAHATAA